MYWHCVLSLCCCYCYCCCVFVLLLFSLCVCCCLCLLLYLSVCCLSWLSCHLCSLCGCCGSAVALPPWCVREWSGLFAAPFQLMRAIILERVFARTYVRWSGRATRPAVKRVIRDRVERTEEQNERVFVCSSSKRERLFWIVWQFSYSKVRKC